MLSVVFDLFVLIVVMLNVIMSVVGFQKSEDIYINKCMIGSWPTLICCVISPLLKIVDSYDTV